MTHDYASSILLVVLRVEEGSIALASIMHVGHLISPGLPGKLLTARGTTTSIEVAALQLAEAIIQEELHHG